MAIKDPIIKLQELTVLAGNKLAATGPEVDSLAISGWSEFNGGFIVKILNARADDIITWDEWPDIAGEVYRQYMWNILLAQTDWTDGYTEFGAVVARGAETFTLGPVDVTIN